MRIRFTSPSWITDIWFEPGVGFTGNDALVVNYLNTQSAALKGQPVNVTQAQALVNDEFSNVTATPEDVAPAAPVVNDVPAAVAPV